MSAVHIPAGLFQLEDELILPPSAKGVVLFELLTHEEVQVGETRFDIALLTTRRIAVTEWLVINPEAKELSVGYFGASCGIANRAQCCGPICALSIAKCEVILKAAGSKPDIQATDRSPLYFGG